MATTISFEYEDKKYILEYDRRTVIMLENKGFDAKLLESKPMTTLYLLWECAFEKHHSNVSIEKRDEILKALGHKDTLFETLITMYSEPAKVLADDEEDNGKKVKWECNKG